jgi:hypothetical protein
MVTFLILAAIISVVVGLWLLNQKQNEELKEINSNIHPFVDDLAPEATPAPVAESIAKKKTIKKKPTVVKKTPAKKVAKKTTKK